MSDISNAGTTVRDDTLWTNIEAAKIIDAIGVKQTQYYSLWAVYLVGQFAVGGYSSNQALSLGVGLTVLAGVWAFNLGHLSFVVQCTDQLNRLTAALNAALDGDPNKYKTALQNAFRNMEESCISWKFGRDESYPRSYIRNAFVHLFIDTCASIALLMRVDHPWVHWIDRHITIFLKSTV
jgi:hypothetical protein